MENRLFVFFYYVYSLSALYVFKTFKCVFSSLEASTKLNNITNFNQTQNTISKFNVNKNNLGKHNYSYVNGFEKRNNLG